MQPSDPKAKVAELVGRIDAVQGEMVRAQHEIDKFSSQNLVVEAREAKDDLARLQFRKRQLEQDLNHLRKHW
ncbi:MAG: hypothetical protein HY565_00570 [Candidatus Kerfeldbacteria bacterium]|nr:hypothetical protein [Candidatus Kerfeldbacteria bacterium]